jgi:hypothetical protein
MKRNGKLPMAIAPMAIAAVLALVAGVLYADPQTNTSSPQSDVTRGKFESDADYFMSVRNYANMDFDKWWGVIAYKTQFANKMSAFQEKIYAGGDLAQIGFATRFGSLYTALSYRGNGFEDFGKGTGGGSSVHSYTEGTLGGKTWKVFDSEPKLDYSGGGGPVLRNEAAVLLGLADMGFRLYYASNYQSYSMSDYAVGSFEDKDNMSYYKSWQEGYGHINPGITWGMTRELIPGRGIKPVVNIDLNFYREYRMREEFTDSGDFAKGTKGTEILRSNNQFIPGLNLSMGAFTLAAVDNFSLDIELDYGIKLYLYENDYSYLDSANKYQVKTLSGGWTYNQTTFYDTFEIGHSLNPSISAGWSGDRLRLACRLSVPMTASTRDETGKGIKPDSKDGSLVKNDYDNTTTEYTLTPALDLAMRWEIIPVRLFLNAGGRLAVFEATFTTIEKAYYENGVENKTDPGYDRGKYITNKFVPAETNLYLGVTFNLTANVELQAALGVDSNNNINVFDSSLVTSSKEAFGRGGLINFGNILVSLKF